MKKNNEEINSINALQCLSLLKEYFNAQETKKIANVEFPSSITYKTEEWLYYIFYSCLLDYGIRSKIYHQNLIKTTL